MALKMMRYILCTKSRFRPSLSNILIPHVLSKITLSKINIRQLNSDILVEGCKNMKCE